MPKSANFKGKGEGVFADMVRRYGAQKGARVFYATANERGLVPAKRKRRVRRRKAY